MPAALLLCAMMLVGCANLAWWPTPAEPAQPAPPTRPAPPETAPEPTPAPLSKAAEAELRYLLDEADRAIRSNHLSDPAKGSALALYQEALAMDPGNETARRGLERIVERYLELATDAAEAGRFDQAQVMVDRARVVDAAHPSIDPVASWVQMLSTAERRVIALDGQQLRDRDPAVEEALWQAGVASQAEGCRAHITARNDSEGRWIYQRMSEAGTRSRIQAQLDIGTPPRIEVLCSSDGE